MPKTYLDRATEEKLPDGAASRSRAAAAATAGHEAVGDADRPRARARGTKTSRSRAPAVESAQEMAGQMRLVDGYALARRRSSPAR